MKKRRAGGGLRPAIFVSETISLLQRLPCITLWRAISSVLGSPATLARAPRFVLHRSTQMAFRFRLIATAFALTPLATLSLLAQPPQRDNIKPSETGAMPPKTWVDKDTGHRVWRVSDEPNSGAFYFNVNAFTQDHKSMVYNSPEGIMVLDLASMKSTLLVANPPMPADAPPAARF